MTESKKSQRLRSSKLRVAYSHFFQRENSSTKLLNLQKDLSSLDRMIEKVLNEEIEIDSPDL